MSVRRQCELLGLNRSSLYYEPAGETAENLRLMRLIDEEYTAHPFYGSRRMTAWLIRQGEAVNRKRVQRLMRRDGSGGHLPQAPAERGRAGPSDLPVFAAGRERRAGRPGVEYGHHLRAAGLGVHVPGGDRSTGTAAT